MNVQLTAIDVSEETNTTQDYVLENLRLKNTKQPLQIITQEP